MAYAFKNLIFEGGGVKGIAYVGAIQELENRQILHSDDWCRTIYINTIGVGTTEFDLDDQQKKKLATEGKKATEDYLNWYDKLDPANPPVNHPDFKG